MNSKLNCPWCLSNALQEPFCDSLEEDKEYWFYVAMDTGSSNDTVQGNILKYKCESNKEHIFFISKD